MGDKGKNGVDKWGTVRYSTFWTNIRRININQKELR